MIALLLVIQAVAPSASQCRHVRADSGDAVLRDVLGHPQLSLNDSIQMRGASLILPVARLSVAELPLPERHSVAVAIGESPHLADGQLVALIVDGCAWRGSGRSVGWGVRAAPSARDDWNRALGSLQKQPIVKDEKAARDVALLYLAFATGQLPDWGAQPAIVLDGSAPKFLSGTLSTIETRTSPSGWVMTGDWTAGVKYRVLVRVLPDGTIAEAKVDLVT